MLRSSASTSPRPCGFTQSPAQATLRIAQHRLCSAWHPVVCFSYSTLNTLKLSPSPTRLPRCSVPCSTGSRWRGCHSSPSNPRSCCVFFPERPPPVIPHRPLATVLGCSDLCAGRRPAAPCLVRASHSLSGVPHAAVSPGWLPGLSGQHPPLPPHRGAWASTAPSFLPVRSFCSNTRDSYRAPSGPILLHLQLPTDPVLHLDWSSLFLHVRAFSPRRQPAPLLVLDRPSESVAAHVTQTTAKGM